MTHKYTAIDIMNMRGEIEYSTKRRIKDDDLVILEKIVGVNKKRGDKLIPIDITEDDYFAYRNYVENTLQTYIMAGISPRELEQHLGEYIS